MRRRRAVYYGDIVKPNPFKYQLSSEGTLLSGRLAIFLANRKSF